MVDLHGSKGGSLLEHLERWVVVHEDDAWINNLLCYSHTKGHILSLI